jgi:hypothetical protein
LPGPLVPRPSPDTPPPAPPPAAPVGTGNVQIAVDKIQPLTVLVAAGFSPWREGEPYKPIREIVTKLNRGELPAGKLLENVDLLSDSELVGREDIFAAWHARFAALRDEEPDDGTRDEKWRFKAFAIQLPFAVPDVNVAREGEPRK